MNIVLREDIKDYPKIYTRDNKSIKIKIDISNILQEYPEGAGGIYWQCPDKGTLYLLSTDLEGTYLVATLTQNELQESGYYRVQGEWSAENNVVKDSIIYKLYVSQSLVSDEYEEGSKEIIIQPELIEDLIRLAAEVHSDYHEVVQIKEDVENIETNIESMQSEVSNLHSETVSLVEDARDIQEDITDRQEDIIDRQSDIQARQNDIIERQTDVTQKQSDVTTKLGQVTQIKSDIESIEDNIETIQSDVTSRQNDVIDRQDDIIERQEIIENIQSDVTNKKTTIESIEDNIEAIQQDVTERQSDVTTKHTQVAQMKSAVEGIQDDIEIRQQDVINRQSDVTSKQSDVASMKSSVESTAAQVHEDAQVNLHPPVVGSNGNWFTWDVTNNVYVDTGMKAAGGVSRSDTDPGIAYDIWIDTSDEVSNNGGDTNG